MSGRSVIDLINVVGAAFYTDYEPSLKTKPNRYRVLAKMWSLKDWLHPSIVDSISDGKQLKI